MRDPAARKTHPLIDTGCYSVTLSLLSSKTAHEQKKTQKSTNSKGVMTEAIVQEANVTQIQKQNKTFHKLSVKRDRERSSQGHSVKSSHTYALEASTETLLVLLDCVVKLRRSSVRSTLFAPGEVGFETSSAFSSKYSGVSSGTSQSNHIECQNEPGGSL